jgi:hypothetical protein
MVKNKKNWNQLSLKERADFIVSNIDNNSLEDIINIYACGGKVKKLQDGGDTKLGVPYAGTNSSNYDYFNASSKNIPEGEEHWTSRNPITGQILKGENHPTFNLALDVEGVLGNNVYKSNIDGKYYSYASNELVPFGMELVNGINQPAIPLDPVRRFEGIKTTKNRPYIPENISLISDRLDKTSLGTPQKNAILGTIIEESGGDPLAVSPDGKFKGLFQWADDRYQFLENTDEVKEMDNQLATLVESLYNTKDGVCWTHGGKGSGYKSGKQSQKAFMKARNTQQATRALNIGNVRPTGKEKSVNNRTKVAKQVAKRLK